MNRVLLGKPEAAFVVCEQHYTDKPAHPHSLIRISGILDPDQDQDKYSDLGPNCLQRLSVDDKSSCKQSKSEISIATM